MHDKNEELAALAARAPEAAPDWIGAELDDLRGRVLTAMRAAAEREERVAKERRSYVGAQLKVLEAQRKLSARIAATDQG